MEAALIVLAILVAALLALVLLRRQAPPPPSDDAQSMLLVQQQVESLRNDLRSSLQNVTENVNSQLGMVMQQIQSQTTNVGVRLDRAASVIGDVQKNLGELGKATEEIKELGQSVSKLGDLLSAPKLRGGLGEYLLEDLLKQVVPAGHFEMQHRFRNGHVVDAVIQTSDRLVPVDSKFPLENFRKMISTDVEAEKKAFQKAFVTDVKKHIDAIATKYILPDEGTFPFALMYIPAENIYYEIIIKDEVSTGTSLYSHAIDRKVVPVSPNSFYAYLQVIALGLKGFYIEQSARDILNALGRLQGDITRVREAFDTLGGHLENARKKYDEAEKRLSTFEGRLDNVTPAQVPGAPDLAALAEKSLLQ
jgi:DNA recombination protein RmuC